MINNRSSVPGDLSKMEVYINGRDVSAAVTDVHIYMDVIGGVWTAKLFFEDSTNLMATLPIKSGAPVKIKVATKLESVGDDEKEFQFAVYNVTDKVGENHMQYTYTVHCAAKAFLIDQKKRVNKYFEGSVTEAIQSLTEEFLESTLRDSRTAEGSVRFIASNWTPLNTVAWAAKSAVYSGRADFMFFQSDNDTFDFMPIDAMYNDRDTGLTFIQRPTGVKENGDGIDDPAIVFHSMQNDHFNALRHGLAGYFASKNLAFDMIEKTWSEEIYTSGDAEGGDNEFSEMAEANVTFTPSHDGAYTGAQNVYDTAKDWTGSRRSELMRLDREKIFIQTPAAVAGWQWLGHAASIDLPSMEDMTKEQYDVARAGKYLITAVAFLYGKGEAVNNYELVKLKLEA